MTLDKDMKKYVFPKRDYCSGVLSRGERLASITNRGQMGIHSKEHNGGQWMEK